MGPSRCSVSVEWPWYNLRIDDPFVNQIVIGFSATVLAIQIIGTIAGKWVQVANRVDAGRLITLKFTTVSNSLALALLYVVLCAKTHTLFSDESRFQPYVHDPTESYAWLSDKGVQASPFVLGAVGCHSRGPGVWTPAPADPGCNFLFSVSAELVSDTGARVGMGMSLIITLGLEVGCLVGSVMYKQQHLDAPKRRWHLVSLGVFVVEFLVTAWMFTALIPVTLAEHNDYCLFITTPVTQRTTMCWFKWASASLPYGVLMSLGGVMVIACVKDQKGEGNCATGLVALIGGAMAMMGAASLVCYFVVGPLLGMFLRCATVLDEHTLVLNALASWGALTALAELAVEAFAYLFGCCSHCAKTVLPGGGSPARSPAVKNPLASPTKRYSVKPAGPPVGL